MQWQGSRLKVYGDLDLASGSKRPAYGSSARRKPKLVRSTRNRLMR
jgi:hypothetical protein